MPNQPKPYVTAALLCERILHEKDESLTVVRIADRIQYQMQGQGLPEGVKPLVTIQGLVSVKSGPVTGDHKIRIIAEKPNGDRKESAVFPVKFLGKDQGQNLILNMHVGVDQDGLYWFDVMFDDELLTRIPLVIIPLQGQEPAGQKTP